MNTNFIIPMNNFNVKDNNINFENNNININKKEIIFKTTTGIITVMHIDSEATVREMLIKYLEEMNHPELINSGKIWFLYNSYKLSFSDEKKIKNLFINDFRQIILVNVTNDLLGGSIYFYKNIK